MSGALVGLLLLKMNETKILTIRKLMILTENLDQLTFRILYINYVMKIYIRCYESTRKGNISLFGSQRNLHTLGNA